MIRVIAKNAERKITAEALAKALGAEIITEFPSGSKMRMYKEMSETAFGKPKPVTTELVDRIKSLVDGVEVDLDAPLKKEDE